MIKHGLENINIENPIDGKLPMLIDYFVKFYGEKYRERITNRLTNATYVFTDPAGKINTYHYLKQHFETTKENLTESFLKDIGINFPILKFQFIDWKSWQTSLKNFHITKELYDSCLIDFISTFLDFPKDMEQKDKEELIYAFLSDNKNNLRLQKFLAKCESYFNKNYKNQFEYLDKEFKRISAPYKENYEKNSEIHKKYDEKLLNFVKSHIITTFGIDQSNPELDEMAAILNSFLKSGRFEIDTDKALKLFNFVSKNEDENKTFEDFINDEDFIKRLRDKKTLKEHQKLEQEETDELLSINPEYIRLKEAIEKEGIYPSSILQVFGGYVTRVDNIVAYVDHTYRLSSSDEPYAVCVLPSLFALDNATLVHELNHIIETDILSNTVFDATIKSGTSTGVLNKSFNTVYGSREQNIFNEVINDYIAIKIHDMMAKDGVKIGMHDHVNSAFSKAFPLLGEFIEENFEDLIECRMSKNPDALFEKFGNQEISILEKATYNLLLTDDKAEIISEIEEKTCKNVNIFDILDKVDLELSTKAKSYIDCYREASYSIGKIKLRKLKEKEIQTEKPQQRPIVAKRSKLSQVLAQRRRERENNPYYDL